MVLSVQKIIQLLRFCLHNTYFPFQNQFHEQVKGAAMGYLIIPIVINLYMEHFERKVFSTATTPRIWMRYVDYTFVIQQEEHNQIFLEHINEGNTVIKCTVESNQQDSAIPFLDTIVKFTGNLCTLINTINGEATTT